MDPKTLDPWELLTLLCDSAQDYGRFRSWSLKERDAKKRARFWAMAGGSLEVTEKLKVEVLMRLGVPLPPNIKNRAAFIYLASSKQGKSCERCHSMVGYGKHLQWWTRDEIAPEPLLLVEATRGAEVKALKKLKELCILLCPRCAKKKGAELTKHGKPVLKK